VKRRELITLLGGAAVWPLAASAQQRERMRRIGVLMRLAADDPEGQNRLAAFLQGLQEVGWAVGRNLTINVRWTAADIEAVKRDNELPAANVDCHVTLVNRAVLKTASDPSLLCFRCRGVICYCRGNWNPAPKASCRTTTGMPHGQANRSRVWT
jgi:hypothetical protein